MTAISSGQPPKLPPQIDPQPNGKKRPVSDLKHKHRCPPHPPTPGPSTGEKVSKEDLKKVLETIKNAQAGSNNIKETVAGALQAAQIAGGVAATVDATQAVGSVLENIGGLFGATSTF